MLEILVVAPMHRIVDLLVCGIASIFGDMGQHPLEIARVRLRPCVPISGGKGHHEVLLACVELLVQSDTSHVNELNDFGSFPHQHELQPHQ